MGNGIDMAKLLEAIDSLIELLNDLASDGGNHRRLDDALTRHVDILHGCKAVQLGARVFKSQTRVEGEGLAGTMEELFGKDSCVSQHAKELAESVPDSGIKDMEIIRVFDEQIGKLFGLQNKLWVDDATGEVLREQIEMLKSLPKIFPKGAPIRESLERRVRSLRKED